MCAAGETEGQGGKELRRAVMSKIIDAEDSLLEVVASKEVDQ